MPELPEVEAARRAIHDHCLGRKIMKASIANDTKVIDCVSPQEFEASLRGKTIVAAHRKGKNMWLELDSPPFPTFQFGMTGAVYIKGVAVTQYKRSAVKDTDEWPSKFSKFFAELDDGLELSFTDKRRLAKVRLLRDVRQPVLVPPISELGPDAFLEPMTVDEFHNSLSKKKIGIKALLLDQNFVSGIGNWIADEVLYQARIHPLQVTSSLTRARCADLLECINKVIEKAVEVGADSSQYPSNWIFHLREKKPKEAFVDGKKIEFITAGGRTTAYVPALQKLTGDQAGKEVGKVQGRSDRKSKRGADDDVDEPESDEEAKNGSVKVNGKKIYTRGKKPSAKRKSNHSDNDSDGDHEKDGQNDEDDIKLKAGARKPPTERKFRTRNEKRIARGEKSSAGTESQVTEDDHDTENDEDGNKQKKVSTRQRKVDKPLAKKTRSSQKGIKLTKTTK